MTNEDIIRMAIEAGLHDEMWFGPHTPTNYEDCLPKIERFAALIAAAERQRIHEYLMRLHLDAGGKHNYLHVAAVGLEDL